MRSLILELVLLAIVATPGGGGTLSCGEDRNGPFLPCPVMNPVNGHYYGMGYGRVDGRNFTWHEARDDAETLTFNGMRGYLATVTSPSESEFLKQSLSNYTATWMGASDAAVEGEWRWMTGPEAGQLFWHGDASGEALGFTDWHVGEPNDLGGLSSGEDYATFGHGDMHDGWNDLPNLAYDASWANGYLVEFSPVPEPSTYALLTIGGVALAIYARQRRT